MAIAGIQLVIFLLNHNRWPTRWRLWFDALLYAIRVLSGQLTSFVMLATASANGIRANF